MRWPALVALCAGLLAGAAHAAQGDPVERHNPADMSKAKAGVLRRADLGAGWTAQPPSGDERCRAFHPDQSALVETGQADTSFARGPAIVGSDVTIYRTEAQARASWNLNAKLAGMQCALEGLRRSLPANATITTLRNARVPYPRLAPRTAAFVLSVRIAVPNGATVDAYFDAVLLGRGRALGGVIIGSLGARYPVAEERRLATLMARRLR
jgi:hypothetical protein